MPNIIDMNNMNKEFGAIRQMPIAITCMVCEKIQPLDQRTPVIGGTYQIVGESICPECRVRLKRLIYPESDKIEESKSPLSPDRKILEQS